jgi:hypothetical protein
MQYFYLKISQTGAGISARLNGMYRDDILSRLLPEGDVSFALVNCSEYTVKAINVNNLGLELSNGFYRIPGRQKVAQLTKLFGPGRLLSKEAANIFIHAGELPKELDLADLKDAYVAVSFKNHDCIVEAPQIERLEPVAERALAKLFSPHLKKPLRHKLLVNSGEIFKVVLQEVIATAARTGITISNFPGSEPGLCTLWFTTGEPLTLGRRTTLAQSPPALMDIGEITLLEDWTTRFVRKSKVTPELFAAHLRIGVESAKATCGCLALLACALLGLIPAFALGDSYRFLPGACLAGAVAFGLASRSLLRLKRKALNRIRLNRKGQES